MRDVPQSMAYQELSFRIEKLVQKMYIANATVWCEEDFETDGVVATMIAMSLSGDITETIDYTEVPLTWWSHLLDRIVPERWERLRGMIKYRMIKTDVSHVSMCPHIPIKDNVGHVSFPVMQDHLDFLIGKNKDNGQEHRG